MFACISPFAGGHNPRIIILFLALTSTTALFLVFFLVLRLSVVKQSRKKLLYIFKQRKTNIKVLDISVWRQGNYDL